jgi:hypothetical protein
LAAGGGPARGPAGGFAPGLFDITKDGYVVRGKGGSGFGINKGRRRRAGEEEGPPYIGIKHASKQKEYGNFLNLLAFYFFLISYGRIYDSL